MINLDDARFDGLDRMPVVQERLIGEGAHFEHAFTPNSTCCPSRASLLTGLYSINHRTLTVAGPIGGADRLRENGGDQRTLAVWLSQAGYRTGLFGKYLNLYSDATEGDAGPDGAFYIPPGWTRWWAMVSSEHFGGIHGEPYEIIEEDGTRTVYADSSSDAEYSTDLSAEKLRDFVADSVEAGAPFFAYWNPYAPHLDTAVGTAAPADRHFGFFDELPPWRPPSYNEGDVSDKPAWVRSLPRPGLLSLLQTDLIRRRAYESLLSVDEQIGEMLAQLQVLDIDRDTLIVLTSDNGASWGEHRWFGNKKGCPYEECQRVPMIVRYPRLVPAGRLIENTAALNLDIAPTLAEAAGVAIPTSIDGRSFLPALIGEDLPEPRVDYLMENWRVTRDTSLLASGPVRDGDRVRLYFGDSSDHLRPYVAFEFDSGDGIAAGAIAVPFAPGNLRPSFEFMGSFVEALVPDATTMAFADRLRVDVVTPDHHGAIWVVEVDAGGVLQESGTGFIAGASVIQIPDFLGLRDVARGYTWVEYETGERELYDLQVDPQQLENRADDPAYAEVRAGLAQRLAELRAEIAANALDEPDSPMAP